MVVLDDMVQMSSELTDFLLTRTDFWKLLWIFSASWGDTKNGRFSNRKRLMKTGVLKSDQITDSNSDGVQGGKTVRVNALMKQQQQQNPNGIKQ